METNESKQLTKVVEDGPTADLLEHVKTLLAQFLEHCFVKRAQSEQYQIERNPKVSILTAAFWFPAKIHPTVLVSDNLDHSKESIIPYMDIIFEMLPDSVQTVSIWSNGPSSQFKNRFMVAAVPLLERKFKKGIVWNYFANLTRK